MSLYNDASLLLIPSGYKSGTVYSQKPTDGDGDLTFTRASDATRVNSDGLIESPRTNLLLQSNTFDTSWIINGTGTITGGQNGYDGTNNAWKLDKSAASTYIGLSTSSSGINTFSIYAKAGTNTHIAFWIRNANRGKFFDLVNGTVGSDFIGTPIDAQIQSMGNGWYRCSIVVDNADNNCRIYPADADGDVSGTSGNIFIQDAQLETGDIATEYIPTTTSARTTFAGITQDGTSAANVPRLDYSQGSCPSLLLEPQRTNSVLYSEQFDNSGWLKIRASVTANAATSPDGYTNAEAIIADTVADDHFVNQNIAVTNATSYAFSAFLKKGNNNWARLWNTSVGYVDFDLTNGVVGTQSSATGIIESFGDGWYRCTILYTASSTSTQPHRIYTLEADNDRSFAGDGSTINLYIWGAQLEQGSYPTSYIPTLGTSVTRVADSCSKTGISDLIGQTEGTLYWEGRTISGVGTDLLIVGDITNSVFINITSSNQVRIGIRANNALLLSPSGGTIAANNKIALAYKSGDIVAYLNGIEVITNSTSFTFSDLISSIEIGRPFYDSKATQFNQKSALFTTRLSNAELAELTTL